MLLLSKINIFDKIGDELVQNTSIPRRKKQIEIHNANAFAKLLKCVGLECL